jgi:peptidoglycan pentaglycine glycine transferase (the first glycine)
MDSRHPMLTEEAGEQYKEELNRWKSWDTFLEAQSSAGFRQSSWYAAFRATCGWDSFGAVLRDRLEIVGGGLVFKRLFGGGKSYYYIPDGPAFRDEDSDAEKEQVFRAILNLLEEKRRKDQHRVSHLCINPRWVELPSFVKSYQFQESEHFYGSPRDIQCIDLSSPESTILAQMKQKCRYSIGVARRHGVSVVEDLSRKGVKDFLSIYTETFIRKHWRGHNSDFFEPLVSLILESKSGSIFFAEYQGVRIATALVVFFGSTATYYHGGSRDIHRNVMAPYLLHFEIMRKAKHLGCRYYDMGGVSPEGEAANSWTGFSIFKRKFGGRELRFVPSLEYVYDPIAYQEWKALRRGISR